MTFTLRGETALLIILLATSRLKRGLQQGTAEILDTAGLTISQWLILSHLCEAGAATLTEIATEIRHDAGALSRAAHLLQQRQLIAATRVRCDRRSFQLTICQSGRELWSSLGMKLSERLNRALGAALGRQEMQTLLQLMERAAASLDSA
jgi:MarR family multiple antibiotic resistance transcriptional regulator